MLYRRKRSSRVAACLTALVLALSSVNGWAAGRPAAEAEADTNMPETGSTAYQTYRNRFADGVFPQEELCLRGTDGRGGESALQDEPEALCLTEAADTASWDFTAKQAGLYCFELHYRPLEGTGSAVGLAMTLDGAAPFAEADELTFPRRYRDERDTPLTDKMGNDIRMAQIELGETIRWVAADASGYVSGPFYFYLSAGAHTLGLTVSREALAIYGLRFFNVEKPLTYAEYRQGLPEAADRGECRIYEAEIVQSKTSTMLYPVSDRSDASTTPSDPLCKKLNVIGGENWNTPDQELVWEIDVPQDGLYTLSFRYKQNFLRGLKVYRTVRIDGAVPFAELEAVPFTYGIRWQTETAGGDEPYRIYLTKGKHQLSMTPTVGEMGEVLNDISDTVARLNETYRRIIMVTGTSPDLFRDYYLQESVPGLSDTFSACADALQSYRGQIEALTGYRGTEAASLDRVADQLRDFVARPNTIPQRLEAFRNNIVTLSSWVLSVRRQSLTLDKFYICPAAEKLPETDAGFLDGMLYHLKAFFGSFVTDYEMVGRAEGDTAANVSVWVSTGRDQADVLKALIDSRFVPEYNIGVSLSLVQGGLMQAFMAGKAPDVALMMGRGDPINYALRGAVCPLEELEGFDTLAAEYTATAFDPYRLNGHCYAVPETESFLMMFCRSDVMEELHISPPETWEDMLSVAETLQRNNMCIGLPYASMDAYSVVSQGIGSQTIFPTLLLQNGNGLYTADLTSTALNTAKAVSAFKAWCEYYTQYDFPLYKDDFNRFRTGEMPLVVTGYTFYNQLVTAAPEIRNMWEMVLLPGTKQQDGTVDRSTASSGTAGMILSTAKDKAAAWTFLRWWNSGETQGLYGMEVENILGAAGRYSPANLTAIRRLPWSRTELNIISAQWETVIDLPEIAGGYYVSRNIDNAFKAVVYTGENYREALSYWNRQIDREITRKRQEFGLDPAA